MLAAEFLDPATLGIIMVFGPGLAAVIGVFWHKIVKTQSENDLKRSMVERGMSAVEIERVLAAKSHGQD